MPTPTRCVPAIRPSCTPPARPRPETLYATVSPQFILALSQSIPCYSGVLHSPAFGEAPQSAAHTHSMLHEKGCRGLLIPRGGILRPRSVQHFEADPPRWRQRGPPHPPGLALQGRRRRRQPHRRAPAAPPRPAQHLRCRRRHRRPAPLQWWRQHPYRECPPAAMAHLDSPHPAVSGLTGRLMPRLPVPGGPSCMI